MDDIDDLFEAKSKSAKKGRRAAKQETELAESTNLEATDTPPRPRKAVGGWGDEDTAPAVSANLSKSGRIRGQDDMSTQFTRFDDDDNNSDNDIPVIPDLEDSSNMEDTSDQVAQAPSMKVNTVASYRDLDMDLQKNNFAMIDKDIDLKLLTKYLSPESECKEEDKPWVWEHLFTEISSELQAQWDVENPEQPEAT